MGFDLNLFIIYPSEKLYKKIKENAVERDGGENSLQLIDFSYNICWLGKTFIQIPKKNIQ